MQTLAIILAVLLLLVGLVPILIAMVRGRFDPFNLKHGFVAFYAIQLGASGLPALITQAASIYGPNPATEMHYYVWALVLSLGGLLFFKLGNALPPVRIKPPALLAAPWNRSKAEMVSYGFLGAGLVAMVVWLRAYDWDVIAGRNAWRGGDTQGQGALFFAAVGLPPLGVMLWTLNRKKVSLRPLIVVWLLSIPAAFAMGFRSAFLLPVLQYVLLWHYTVKQIHLGKLLLLLAVAGIVFTGYGIWRTIPPEWGISLETADEVVSADPELLYGVISRSKGTEVVASVIKDLDQFGVYEYGYRGLFESATIFIPGAWWDKPIPSSLRFTTRFFGNALAVDRQDYEQQWWGGISPTIVGELYWNFSWPGVLLGMFLLGILTRTIYETMLRYHSKPGVMLVYATLFVTWIGYAEAPQGYTNTLVLNMIVIVAAMALVARRALPRAATAVARSRHA